MELVDVTDSKSVGSDTVWVRVPPPAPRRSKFCIACSDLFYKSERAHTAAPPLRIRPAALGFDSASPLRGAFIAHIKISVLTALCTLEQAPHHPPAPAKQDRPWIASTGGPLRFYCGSSLPRSGCRLLSGKVDKMGVSALAFLRAVVKHLQIADGEIRLPCGDLKDQISGPLLVHGQGVGPRQLILLPPAPAPPWSRC